MQEIVSVCIYLKCEEINEVYAGVKKLNSVQFIQLYLTGLLWFHLVCTN